MHVQAHCLVRVVIERFFKLPSATTMTATQPIPRPTAKTLAVFAAGISFIGMGVSGVVLFVRPLALLGSRLNYAFLGIDAAGWIRVHIVFAILFLIAGAWHIVLHFGVIRTFLFGMQGRHRGHWPEAAILFGVAILILVTAVLDVPPSSWIIELKTTLGRTFGQA